MDAAVRPWAVREARRHAGVLRIGYFGSYARGTYGVGSDLNLVAVVRDSHEPFERRAVAWDLAALPVPAELLVYTENEWRRLKDEGGRFARMLESETVWVFPGRERLAGAS